MRSFAVIAAISAIGAQAMPEYYAAESSTPVYEVTTPAYAASTPVYAASSAYEAYPVSSSAAYPEYPAASSSAVYKASTPVYSQGYAVSSSASYAEYTTTKVVKETTFVCPTPTVVTYEQKTYTVTKSTVLSIPAYSTVVTVKPTPTPEAGKSSSKPVAPVYSSSVPAAAHTAAPYPSTNGTVPHYTAPQGTATGYPTSTKPSTPEFTGAAAQAGVGLLAVVGALAAFL